MKRILAMCLAACLLLAGCASWMDGSYTSVTPHQQQSGQPQMGSLQAENYQQLRQALDDLTENGVQSSIIYVSGYDAQTVKMDMQNAARSVMEENPIAAYAVDKIDWELGTNGGKAAIAVSISYLHDRAEIVKIRRAGDLTMVNVLVQTELKNSSSGVVLYFKNYQDADFAQMVENFAFQNPQHVMECPGVTVNIYPNRGTDRVVELKFTYQNSRDTLREMYQQVRPLFTSAVLFVSGDMTDMEKYSQLYSFLMMDSNEFRVETSNTPAYSLLRHHVGDAKALATVYAAMCREAGLQCRVISGTKNGEPWYWNQIEEGGIYYHVDILKSREEGDFGVRLDEQMSGYVWDYSAFPASLRE